MSLTLHSQSIPVLVKHLRALSMFIDKAAAFCADKKIEDAVMTNMRLAPDMFAFSRQIQIAGDMAKGCAARLGGIEIPKYEDTEQTFDELKARIAKTITFIESVPSAQIDAATDKPIEIKTGNGKTFNFTGHTYLNTWALPNFYFHFTTAYNILRHNGVPLTKADYLA